MIYYRKRKKYKYNLAKDYTISLKQPELKGHTIENRYCGLQKDGTLTIFTGYCWDGASGPTIDTKTAMRGALVHDCLYQLMREELLPQDCRGPADREFRIILLEDGMSKMRAWVWYQSVKRFAKGSAKPDLLKAP